MSFRIQAGVALRKSKEMQSIGEIIRHWGLESTSSIFKDSRHGDIVSSTYFKHPDRQEWFRISDHLLPEYKLEECHIGAWHKVFGTADIAVNRYYSRSTSYYEKALTELCELPDIRPHFKVGRNRFDKSGRNFTIVNRQSGDTHYLLVLPNGNVSLASNAGFGKWTELRLPNFRAALKRFAS